MAADTQQTRQPIARAQQQAAAAAAPPAGGASPPARAGGGSAAAGAIGPAVRRLMTDLRELERDAPPGCSAGPVSDEDVFFWRAAIVGPSETPFEGGIYALTLRFSSQYPAEPPDVRFACEMFHPNIYPSGEICLDILREKWSPVLSVAKLLQSILSLLTDPDPEEDLDFGAANPEAAKMYVQQPKQYRRRVRQCAERSLDSC